MNESFMRGLAAGLFAMFVLAGCQSAGEPEPMPEEPMDMATSEPAPPPPMVQVERPETNADGYPLGDDGQPIGYVFYFEFDRTELTPQARTLLAEHADYLRTHGAVRIVIQGHADERGTREYNLALGERRAAAVSDYLQSLGVSSSQLSLVSYGEERPVDPRSTEAAWAKNRRAELVY
ncbi:MAG: peptidoglycan-associated lipoprotein Pal [Pseudomonadales bacterium]|nr:peptidoglycan-associated lipoprotein Pal [Pseudomonadales bacterium]